MSNPNVQGYYLDEETRYLLAEIARREDRSRSNVIRRLVREKAKELGITPPAADAGGGRASVVSF